jgi:ribosomal protein S12
MANARSGNGAIRARVSDLPGVRYPIVQTPMG